MRSLTSILRISCFLAVSFTTLQGTAMSSFESSSVQPFTTANFDRLYSEKPLGYTVNNNSTVFRVFVPRAFAVTLVVFDTYDAKEGTSYPMQRDDEGIWEITLEGQLYGKFYGYKIQGPEAPDENFDADVVIADPYSRAVVTRNEYRHPAKTLILDTRYDWSDDTFTPPENHNSLVLYEMHVRDMTAHPSSGAAKRGTYSGLVEHGRTGGISYLKDLGVNAIELLPIHEFANIEPPFNDSSTREELKIVNTWNHTGRNHWGYMTSYFFAPESYYASDGTIQQGSFSGTQGKAVKELKDMIKAFHKEKIAVIMDVVYNHVSQYDYNPLKYIDKKYYFHLDSNGNYLSLSGCGNDFRTDRPMARRLIVESILYWLKEYNVDGFRFDLATMIDWETCRQIIAEARKIKPNVIIIAEPWGGGKYDPAGFSNIGWMAWNDVIRNGVKGQNPYDGHGFIFGKFQGSNTSRSLRNYLLGSLARFGGPFQRKSHSVNYLESHDDHTMGDFIRLGLRDNHDHDRVHDIRSHTQLTARQQAVHKLAALFLMVSQGPVMIHEGQEFARSKVITSPEIPADRRNTIDHNSYNKDDATNYINYDLRDINKSLYDYYKGLIAFRNKYPDFFGSAETSQISFFETDDSLFLGLRIESPASEIKPGSFLVYLNGNPADTNTILLPPGKWHIMVNGRDVSLDTPLGTITGAISVPPTTGIILSKAE